MSAPTGEQAALGRSGAAINLDELVLCFRLHANLARASVLIAHDRECAAWFLQVARAAVEEPDAPLPSEVLRELHRLLDVAVRSLESGDVAGADSATALAEGLCVVRMLRRASSPQRSPA